MSIESVFNSYNVSLDHHQFDTDPFSPYDFVTKDQSGSFGSKDTFSGIQNPYWKAQIRAGVGATTPATGTRYEYNVPLLQATVQKIRVAGISKGSMYGDSFVGFPILPGLFTFGDAVPPELITEVNNRAIRKLIQSVDGVRSSFESGQDIGEIGETIRGILHPMAEARSLILSHLSKLIKVGTVKNITKASYLKAIADTVLEWRFGWAPLASDIGAGLADLTNNISHPSTIPVRASATGTWSIADPFYWTYSSGGNLIADCFAHVNGEFSVTFKGAVKTGAVNGKIPVNQLLQLDLEHVGSTAWDLLPYSWVADKFANIGEIIRSASFQFNNFAWCNTTTRITTRYVYPYSGIRKPTLGVNDALLFVQDPLDAAVVKKVVFSRHGTTPSDLIPDFRFNIPLTERPYENIVALVGSRIHQITDIIRNLRK